MFASNEKTVCGAIIVHPATAQQHLGIIIVSLLVVMMTMMTKMTMMTAKLLMAMMVRTVMNTNDNGNEAFEYLVASFLGKIKLFPGNLFPVSLW